MLAWFPAWFIEGLAMWWQLLASLTTLAAILFAVLILTTAMGRLVLFTRLYFRQPRPQRASWLAERLLWLRARRQP